MTSAELKALIKEMIGEDRASLREEIVAQAQEANKKDGLTIADVIRGDLMREKVENEPLPANGKGMAAARALRAMSLVNGNRDGAVKVLKQWGNSDKAIKALSSETMSGGGALIAPEIGMEIIEALTPKTVVRALGAQTMTLHGTYSQPFEVSGTTAYYTGEKQNIQTSDEELAMLTLTERELAVIVPIPNRLRELASIDVDAFVLRKMLKNLRVKEDQTFLRSKGTQFAPKGLLYWAANKFNANATASLANVIVDLGKAIVAVEDQDVPMENCGWVMRPSTKWFLMTLTDGNGNKIFFDEMLKGTLLTYPFKTTSSVPKNLGNGSQTEVYFADFGSILIGQNDNVQVAVNEGASYWDGEKLVSTFSTNQTAMRAIFYHDLSPLYGGKEITVIEACGWVL